MLATAPGTSPTSRTGRPSSSIVALRGSAAMAWRSRASCRPARVRGMIGPIAAMSAIIRSASCVRPSAQHRGKRIERSTELSGAGPAAGSAGHAKSLSWSWRMPRFSRNWGHRIAFTARCRNGSASGLRYCYADPPASQRSGACKDCRNVLARRSMSAKRPLP